MYKIFTVPVKHLVFHDKYVESVNKIITRVKEKPFLIWVTMVFVRDVKDSVQTLLYRNYRPLCRCYNSLNTKDYIFVRRTFWGFCFLLLFKWFNRNKHYKYVGDKIDD